MKSRAFVEKPVQCCDNKCKRKATFTSFSLLKQYGGLYDDKLHLVYFWYCSDHTIEHYNTIVNKPIIIVNEVTRKIPEKWLYLLEGKMYVEMD